MKTLGWVLVMVLALVVPVRAAQVYSGCSVPSAASRHLWYIDPVHGKSPAAGGDGSPANPWNSLTGVIGGAWATTGFTVPGYMRPLLSSVPYAHFINGRFVDVADQVGNPPVQPGDTIYLMSGNYGDVGLGNFNTPTTNSDFVVVEAAMGQTPVFDTLSVSRTNKWVFDAIKVQSVLGTNGNNNGLVTISDQGAAFPTKDIIFTGMDLSTFDTIPPGFTQAKWIAQGRSGFIEVGSAGNGTNGIPYTTCVSMTGSRIHNVAFGAQIMGNNSVFSNNEINYFADDALDYAASNLTLTHNYIHNSFGTENGIHTDAMQGQNGALPLGIAYNQFSNILIDSNTIIRQTDPNLQFGQYLQGIDAFDEDWTNVTITNNVIVTSSCYGVFLASIHNSLIANNTAVNDGLLSTPGCAPVIGAGDKTHEGPSSSNTVVRNNITSELSIANGDPGVEADHNVILCCNGQTGALMYWTVNGVGQFNSRPGVYNNGPNVINIIDSLGPTGEFVNFSPSTLTYTVMLKPGAQAIRAGSPAGPRIDILGYTRAPPYAVGAYSYPR